MYNEKPISHCSSYGYQHRKPIVYMETETIHVQTGKTCTVLVSYNHSVIPISMFTISICAIFVGTNITNIYEEEKTQLGQYLCMHGMVSQVCIVFWVGKMHLVTRHFVRIPFPGETSTGNPIILQNM